MKIQYMSDLHIEFGDMPKIKKKGDILVLAGDIHIGLNSIPFLNECSSTFKDVILVLGNHEFYHNDFSKLFSEMRKNLKDNIHLLQNEIITLDGITFAGSTLWASMPLSAFLSMNDSRLIMNGNDILSHNDVLKDYEESYKFLYDNRDSIDVIVTHHAPSINSLDTARYGFASPINRGYYTDILSHFENSRVKAWIHGHTHHCCSYNENGIQVVSNQRGYVNNDEVVGFNPKGTIQI